MKEKEKEAWHLLIIKPGARRDAWSSHEHWLNVAIA